MGTSQSKQRRSSSSAKSVSSAKSGMTRSDGSTARWSRNDSRTDFHTSQGEEDSQSLSRSLSPSENGWDDSDIDGLKKMGREDRDTVSLTDTGSMTSGSKRSGFRRRSAKGTKEVKVIKTYKSGWDEFCSQTGESRYERQIIDQYYYTPVREKPKQTVEYEEEEQRKKKESRLSKKAAKEARAKSVKESRGKRGKLFRKSKDVIDPEPCASHPAMKAVEMSKRMGVFTVAKKEFDHLPEEVVEQLPGTVTVMDLSHNKFTIIPVGLCKYVLAARFSAAHNSLTAVPAYFGKMTGLRKVDFSHNQIEFIPDELFRNMKELEELDLSHNQLSTIPSSLFSAPKMLLLNVSHNRITSIPKDICRMAWLMDFDISGNMIDTIPETMCENEHLRKLVIDDNKVSSIPAALLDSCIELRLISMKRNPIKLAALKATPGFQAYIDRCVSSRPKYLSANAEDVLDEYLQIDP